MFKTCIFFLFLLPFICLAQVRLDTTANSLSMSNVSLNRLTFEDGTTQTTASDSTFEALTGNQFSLGNSSVTNISNTATGAFVAARVTGTNSIGDRAYGASQQGWISGTASIGVDAFGVSQQGRISGTASIGNYAQGARQQGFISGTASISNSAHGASQQGHIFGTAVINSAAYGASQQGLIPGTASIGADAYGASQQGNIFGSASIGNFAYGASQQGLIEGGASIGQSAHGAIQIGHLNSSSTATNFAKGAIQIMGGVGAEVYTTTSAGAGSLLLGPGTQSNAYGILANGPIQTLSGFVGNAADLTNFPALVVTTNNLSTIAGSGLGVTNNQLVVTNVGVTTFEELTGNRMLLGSGTLSFIETNAIGASQMGNFGNVKIGSGAYGASQHGISLLGSMEIKALSYGASQQGEFNAPATIGSLAPGAMQFGSLTSGSATNNGAGAMQLIGGGGTYLTTSSADGSLLLGPGTQSNAYGILANGLIESLVGFKGEKVIFDTTSTTDPLEGELIWNADHGNLVYGLKNNYHADVNPEIIWVRNDTGVDIPAGVVVARDGQVGSSSPSVKLFEHGDRPLGVTVQTILGSGDTSGYVASAGFVYLDTQSLGTGCLYAGSSGALITTPPAPPIDTWSIGCVVISGSNGKILVNIASTKSYTALDNRYVQPSALASYTPLTTLTNYVPYSGLSTLAGDNLNYSNNKFNLDADVLTYITPINSKVGNFFQNSSYAPGVSTNTPVSLLGTNYGFYIVSDLSTIINPVKLFGENKSYRIHLHNRVDGGFNDGLHVLVRLIDSNGNNVGVSGLNDVHIGTSQFSRFESTTLNSGNSLNYYYRLEVYFAAYDGGNGGTIQDTTIYLIGE